MLLNEKKQKNALLRNSKNLKNIHDDYYLKDEYKNIEYNKTIIRTRNRYHAKEILLKYHIESIIELFFLLHYYAGEIINVCKFCGKNITRVKKRDDTYNYDDCKHKGICIMCKEPHEGSNPDGVCYRCKPHRSTYEDQNILDNPEKIRYMFLQIIGNHENICHLDDIDTVQKMMDCASFYYGWFKDIKNNLNKRNTINKDKFY